MKILIVIPARIKSSRFPAKIFYPILDKPMILHVYDRIKSLQSWADIIFAVDDIKTVDFCIKNDLKYIMTDSLLLSGTDRVIEVAKTYKADIYINLQCDEVLVTTAMLKDLLSPYFFSNSFNGVLTLKNCIQSENDFYDKNVVKVVTDKNNNALYFSRSVIPYGATYDKAFKHIGIYAYTKDVLDRVSKISFSAISYYEGLEQLAFLDYNIDIKVLDVDYESISVNVFSDIIKVEKYLKDLR